MRICDLQTKIFKSKIRKSFNQTSIYIAYTYVQVYKFSGLFISGI